MRQVRGVACAGCGQHSHLAPPTKGGKGGAPGGGPLPSRYAASASSAILRRLALQPAQTPCYVGLL